MPTLMQGDYSNYPPDVATIFKYVYGEVCELRIIWDVYRHLFMDDEARTKRFGERLGGIAGNYQQLLQDELILAIARLTDPDSRSQSNLGIPALIKACQRWDSRLSASLLTRFTGLQAFAVGIRRHRHKRLAHYDLSTSLGESRLPVVTLKEIRESIEIMCAIVQDVAFHAEATTIVFDVLNHGVMTSATMTTIAKAAAFDFFVAQGAVDEAAWRRFVL